MNNKYEIPFLIFDVKDHLIIKDKILDGIQKMGKYSLIDENQNIANSDYHLSKNIPRQYYQYTEKIFNDVAEFLNEKFNYDGPNKCFVGNYWFQQYENGGMHKWHRHPNTSFSCCYYVDLSNDSPKTSFELFGETFEIDVKEGVVLIFPSFLKHCSKPNKSKHTKTIVSFNVM
jgi:oxalate decarboxylase/phosphoglucose isomerase-like protein (cupin superfamily)